DIGTFSVVARPTLREFCDQSPQNFAAPHIRRVLFLLGGFGMKRTFVRRQFAFGCDRGECAMIRDRDPGAERQRNNHTTRARFHAVFNRSRAANAQIFSFGSAMGATPAATSDGGMPSDPVGEKWTGATGVCSRRVDISMAVKSNAPAR